MIVVVSLESLKQATVENVCPKLTMVEMRLGNDTPHGGSELFKSDGELCGVEGGVGVLLSDVSITNSPSNFLPPKLCILKANKWHSPKYKIFSYKLYRTSVCNL